MRVIIYARGCDSMGKKEVYVEAWKKGVDRGHSLTETRETVSDKLRLLREQHRYTQKQVAELANIDPTTYAGYENKISTPAIAVLIRIADVYEISLDYLTGRTENPRGLYAASPEEQPMASNVDIISRFEKLERELTLLKEKL